MTKIFFNNSTILLTDEKPDTNDYSFEFRKVAQMGVYWLLNQVACSDFPSEIYIWGETPATILARFQKELTVIVAGGGLIRNPGGEVLFIFRKGKWDFPKGKPEGTENIENTALREVEEECGLKKLRIIAPLPDTYHIYSFTEKVFALKQCKWFLMETSANGRLTLQTEEGITDAQWIALPFPEEIINGAYFSIRQLAIWYQQNYLRLPGRWG